MIKLSAILLVTIVLLLSCGDDDSGVNMVDGTAPSGISDFRVIDSTATSVILSWTAPGDDGSVHGTATSYDIRYASSGSAILINWPGAIAVADPPPPSTPGSVETDTITGLAFNGKYYFGIRTIDEAGNTSVISNVVKAIPFEDSTVSFADANLFLAVRNHLSIPSGPIFYSEALSLDTFNASSSSIADISDIYYLGNLHYLNLNDNTITNIDALAQLSELDTLYLSNNQIDNIDSLLNLTELLALTLEHNQIDTINNLFALSKLRHLNLGNNSIDSITSLFFLDSLTELYLDSNQIIDIRPLVDNVGLDSGDVIWLNDNQLSDSSINVHIPALEARGVTIHN